MDCFNGNRLCGLFFSLVGWACRFFGLVLAFLWFGLVWLGVLSFDLLEFQVCDACSSRGLALIAGKLFKQHRGACIGFPISAALCIVAVMNTELRVSQCYSLYEHSASKR